MTYPIPDKPYPIRTKEQWSQLPRGKLKNEDVFTAYYECKRGKENTFNTLKFAKDFERKCFDLCERINRHIYQPGNSVVFIVNKPVTREVFAPSFESRVADHVVSDKLEPLMEDFLSDDNYATRPGRGTLFGVERIAEYIRQCTGNYTKDAWILKTDIEGYFMAIDKERAYSKMAWFAQLYYHGDDKMEIIYLLWAILMDRPETHCIRRCPLKAWKKLPPQKSLFHADPNHGLPIGRLTSQLAASLYLDEIDKKLKTVWGVPFCGRYVDDIVMVHERKDHLLAVCDSLKEALRQEGLTLHPRKHYLQPCRKGVNFVGGFILPGRIYATRRSIGFAFDAVAAWNRLAMNGPAFVEEHAERMASMVNSYLGHLRHFAAYNVRRRLLDSVDPAWWTVLAFPGSMRKVMVKAGHRSCDRFVRELYEIHPFCIIYTKTFFYD